MTPEDPKTTPCGCACTTEPPKQGSSRRDFMLKLGLGLNVVAGAMISVPILGYALSSFIRPKKLSWVSLGAISQFPEGTTRMAVFQSPGGQPWDGTMTNIPCWVRHIKADDPSKKEEFQIFAINCTHLGCPVRWFEESKLFMCPCHGGVFYQDGSHAAGPPPRGLYTYGHKVEDGELKVLAGEIPSLANPNI